jgi:hypothetical protein
LQKLLESWLHRILEIFPQKYEKSASPHKRQRVDKSGHLIDTPTLAVSGEVTGAMIIGNLEATSNRARGRLQHAMQEALILLARFKKGDACTEASRLIARTRIGLANVANRKIIDVCSQSSTTHTYLEKLYERQTKALQKILGQIDHDQQAQTALSQYGPKGAAAAASTANELTRLLKI